MKPKRVAREHVQPGMVVEFGAFTLLITSLNVTPEQITKRWPDNGTRTKPERNDVWVHGYLSRHWRQRSQQSASNGPWKLCESNSPRGWVTVLREEPLDA